MLLFSVDIEFVLIGERVSLVRTTIMLVFVSSLMIVVRFVVFAVGLCYERLLLMCLGVWPVLVNTYVLLFVAFSVA